MVYAGIYDPELNNLTLGEMKSLLKLRNVVYSNFIEKKEYVAGTTVVVKKPAKD